MATKKGIVKKTSIDEFAGIRKNGLIAINIDEGAGQYKITDDTGKLIGCGGGVAFDEDGKERPLTAEELYNYAAEEMTTDVIGGRMYLLYKNKKIDITDIMILKRHIIAGSKENWKLKGEKLQIADINEDGQVNITDMILLKREIIENL